MHESLIEKFSKYEVETAEELVACVESAPRASKFRRMLLLFLRGHYSSKDNYGDEYDHLGCYTWSPVEKDRKLDIQFSHLHDDNNPESYPGIYIVFSDLSLTKLGIGSNYAGSSDDSASTHLSKESVLNFTINHVAKEASDAFDLAEMTMTILTAMGPILAHNGGATGFEVTGLTQPKKKKDAPGRYYTVATSVEIRYTLAVTRTQESHRIRMIVQKLGETTQ